MGCSLQKKEMYLMSNLSGWFFKEGRHVSTYTLSAGTPSCLALCRSSTCCDNTHYFIHASVLFCPEDLEYLVFSILTALKIFLPPLMQARWPLKGEICWRSPPRTEYSEISPSLAHYPILSLWLRVFVPINCRNKLLWWCLFKTLIYE